MATAPDRFALAQLLRDRFPTSPVPPYPKNIGLSPIGPDEYLGFRNVPWNEVDAEHYRCNPGYDICPTIGFRMYDPPHMWNYYLPGFLTAVLLHEDEHEIIDGVMWELQELKVPRHREHCIDPWWGGSKHFENYGFLHREAVSKFLTFIREHGESAPWYWEWGPKDTRTLARWTDDE